MPLAIPRPSPLRRDDPPDDRGRRVLSSPDKSFDDTSVTEIARRGRRHHRRLLRSLRRQGRASSASSRAELREAFEALTDAQATPARWTGRAIAAALRQHHESLVRTYRSHRGAARALLLKTHTDPALRARIDKLNQRNLPRIAKAIAEHTRISHPAAERALQFALLTVRSVCRETLLYDQSWPGGRALSDKELVDELTRMVVAYLGIKAGGRN